MSAFEVVDPVEGPEPHWVYRLSDAGGVCLYVGVSRRPGGRFAQHASDKVWWPLVAGVEMTRYPDRDVALRAEREEIRERGPVHNVVHNLDGNARRPMSAVLPEAHPVADETAERFQDAVLDVVGKWAKGRLAPGSPANVPIMLVCGWIWALYHDTHGELP